MFEIAASLGCAALALLIFVRTSGGSRRTLLLNLLGYNSLVVYGLPYFAFSQGAWFRALPGVLLLLAIVHYRLGMRTRTYGIGIAPYVVLILGLLVTMAVSLLWTPDQAAGIDKILGFGGRTVVPVVAVALLAPLDGRDLWALLKGGAAASLTASIQLVSNPKPFELWSSRYTLAPDVHPNAAARDFGVLVVVLLAMAIVGRRSEIRSRLGLFVVSGIGVAALLYTGSRGPLLGAVVGVAAAVVLVSAYRALPRVVLGVLVLATVAIMLPAANVPDAISEPASRVWEKGIPGLSDGDLAEGDSGRLERYELALRLVRESQFGGVGVAGFGNYWVGEPPGGIEDGREYPHNLALELACELGVLGLMLLLGLVVAVGRGWQRLRTCAQPGTRAALLGLWAYAAFNVSVSGDLATNSSFFVSGALIALAGKRSPRWSLIENHDAESIGEIR